MANPLFYTEVKKIEGGATYQVVDVQNADVLYSKPVDNVEYFGDEIAIELKKHLVVGDSITIPVDTVTTKGSGDVLLEDFTIVEIVELEQYKAKKKAQVNNIFTPYLTSTGGIVLFNALNSFAILASQQYFITDANREEKYLEIINTGDESLISALEDYLDAYDLISPVAALYKTKQQFELDVDAALTIEDVDAAFQLFETAM